MTPANHQRIVPMIWFDNQAEEAARFYASIFPNSSIGRISHYVKEGFEIHNQPEGTVMTVEFELDGSLFSALNGGPHFKINPAISFFVVYESEKQVDEIWRNLSDGGVVLMALDKYPWSKKYGWVQDRFGVTWQISMGNKEDIGGQSIGYSLLFVKEYYGKAEQAIKFYTSIFEESTINGILRYGTNELPDKDGTVKHAQFTLNGQTFMVMDSAHAHQFTFNEAISLVVYCKDQKEIDYYWDNLSEGGDPKAQMCGWLKDQFGVSWQIVPTIMDDMMMDSDVRKIERVTKAYLQMKKFDIETLIDVFEGR